MAIYPKAVLKLLPADNHTTAQTMTTMIYHIAVSMADSLYDYFLGNQTGNGIEAHFYIRLDGVVEQYRDTKFRADANVQANPFAISVETQGFEAGTWTDAQMQSIKELSVWAHEDHPIPFIKCSAWNSGGFGYHNLFATEWAGGPRGCPGAERVVQFNNVLVPWFKNPVLGEDMSAADVEKILAAIAAVGVQANSANGSASMARNILLSGTVDQGLNSKAWPYPFPMFAAMRNDTAGIKVAVADDASQQDILDLRVATSQMVASAIHDVLAGFPDLSVDADALSNAIVAKLVDGTTLSINVNKTA